ncbi:hypothetical protein CGZ75_07625 [Paenibacillus herberti]|uniref:Cas12f1-like TNB domain-containing protein n=1 Tax=Paenibacillus herberti TaxID=1619309 RepID=A0A229P629_9BACL|nr:hypothetical protein CGZ75_07625 [Paenibacillus herberti]
MPRRRSGSTIEEYDFPARVDFKTDYGYSGHDISVIAKNYPSSQLCHVCGFRNPEVKQLGIREWSCSDCGTQHDRDHNASLNILNEGLRLLVG